MEVSWENPGPPIWSPDGKAFAYSAGAAGQRRIFLRYLNSPAATPLTDAARVWGPVGWSADSKRVFANGLNPQGTTPPYALFSIPVFGGEPEFVRTTDAVRGRVAVETISPDGNTLALLGLAENGRFTVFTASPPGSALRRYTPAPFETNGLNPGSSRH